MGDELRPSRPINEDAEGSYLVDFVRSWDSPPSQSGETVQQISTRIAQMEQVLGNLITKHMEPISKFSQQMSGLRHDFQKEMERFWEELPSKSELTKLQVENDLLRKGSVATSDRPVHLRSCSRPEPVTETTNVVLLDHHMSAVMPGTAKAAWGALKHPETWPMDGHHRPPHHHSHAQDFSSEPHHPRLPGQSYSAGTDSAEMVHLQSLQSHENLPGNLGFAVVPNPSPAFQASDSHFSVHASTDSQSIHASHEKKMVLFGETVVEETFIEKASMESAVSFTEAMHQLTPHLAHSATATSLSDGSKSLETSSHGNGSVKVMPHRQPTATFAEAYSESVSMELELDRKRMNRRTCAAKNMAAVHMAKHHGKHHRGSQKSSVNHEDANPPPLWSISSYVQKQNTVDAGSEAAKPKAVFADVNAMKDKLRENLGKPKYDVANFYHKTGFCQRVARAHWFEHVTLFVIALNAIWLAIDTEHNDSPVITQSTPFFQIGENLFCTYFTIEWVIRFVAFKRKRDCLKDAWLVFDACLVFMMVGETWVMYIIFSIQSSDSGGLGNTSIVRLVRLLRLTRMARMAKLLVAMPELNILIKGVSVAFRSVFFTLVLLLVVIYMFGIAFSQLMVDTEPGEKYFNGLSQSMMTLLLHATFLDDLPTVVRKVGNESLFYGAVLMLFVLIASLTVMNMLIGILCEVVSVVSAIEKEACMLNYVKEKMHQMLDESGLDKDGDGLISKLEFEQLIEIPEAAQALSEVGVDVLGLVDCSDFIFGADGNIELTFQDFMDVVLELRGSNGATVKDIVDLRKFFLQELSLVEEKVAKRIIGASQKLSRITLGSK